MSSKIQLDEQEEDLLRTLVRLHSNNVIKGKELVDHHDDLDVPECREMIRKLKSFKLVEGITGPNGGYKPTTKAYSYVYNYDNILLVDNGNNCDVNDFKIVDMAKDTPRGELVLSDMNVVSVGDNIELKLIESEIPLFVSGTVTSKTSKKVIMEIEDIEKIY